MESDMSSPHLTFLGWDRPILPAAAAHLVEHYATQDTADMRSATVVLPGKRARRRMVELLVEVAVARNVTLIPPSVTTVGHLPDLFRPPSLPTVDPVLARRAWSKALRATGPQALSRVFPHLREDAPLGEWDELAAMLAGMHENLAREGHCFADVARICRSGVSFDDSPRWDALVKVQRGYLGLLTEAGMADPFEARMAALESGVQHHPGDIWLVSIVELPAVTRRLVEASGAAVHALIHAPAELAGQEPAPFDAWGLPVTEAWEGAYVPVTDDILRMVGRPVDQADAAVAALEDLDGAYATDDVILGVHPQSEVLPYLEQRLTARGVAARYAAGTPLARTPAVRLLQAAADYLDGHAYLAMAALLRHPDARALLQAGGAKMSGGHALDTADAYFNEHLPYALGGLLPFVRGSAEDFPPLVRALDHKGPPEGPLHALRGRKPLSKWMPVVMNFLLETYEHLELDRSRPEHRRLTEVLTQIRSVALTLDLAPGALDEECTGAQAIRSVLAGVQDQALPPDPDRAAVELLEWLEVPLDDAPVAVLTGFNEGFLPESVSGHPFLPDALCTQLRLPDNRRRLARDAYRLTCVLHSKDSVRLIAGRRTAKGDPLRPSRLMFRTAPEDLAPRVIRFLDATDAAPAGMDLASLGLEPRAESAFRVPPDPVIELAEDQIPRSLRVTEFKNLLDDQYRFVLEQVLKLERTDDEARELDPLGFGNLAHAALQRFGELALADPPEVDVCDADAVANALVKLLRQEVVNRFGRFPLPAVLLQADQLEARFRAFARAQAAWAAQGWRIVAVECKPEGDGWPLDVDGSPMLLRGRMDRIDHNPSTGEWAVLDYKTGSKRETPEEAHRTGRAAAREWANLQLPLYRHMLETVVAASGERIVPVEAATSGAVRLGYIVLPEDPAESAFLLADWTEDELRSALDVAREAVRGLRRGRFEFDPGETRPGPAGYDALRPLLAVGWQAASDAAADTEEDTGSVEGQA